MTKLNVVIPAVNVTVDGVEFRKVDRKAQAGDIVKAIDNPCVDITVGQFYAAHVDESGELYVRDDEDDRNWGLDNYPRAFEVYTPVIAEVTSEYSDEITFENAQYRKVDRSAREGDVVKCVSYEYDMTYGGLYAVIAGPGVVDNVNDFCAPFESYPEDFEVYEKVSVETPVTTYREVKRKAAVGERIKIVNPIHATDYGMGDEFVTVRVSETGGARFMDNAGELNIAYLREYVVLELVSEQVKAEPERLTVGDYVRISCARYPGDSLKIGEVRKIAKVDGSDIPYKADKLDGSDHDWFRAGALEKLTEEEVSAIEKEAQETAKWAKIGRKVGEYKRGDIVEATHISSGGRLTGVVNDLERADSPNLGITSYVDGTYRAVYTEGATLITPVEQRFDTESAAA